MVPVVIDPTNHADLISSVLLIVVDSKGLRLELFVTASKNNKAFQQDSYYPFANCSALVATPPDVSTVGWVVN